MKTFRKTMRGPIGRVLAGVMLVSTVHISADPRNYLAVIEQQRQREDQIRAIAAKMNVDPEFLLNPQGRTRFDFRSLFRQLGERLGFETSNAAAASNDQPVEIRESIKRVKDRYALVAADTTLARIAELVQVSSSESMRGKKKGQIKAELQSVLRLIDKDFLPPVKEDASSIAKSRDTEMRREIKDLQKRVKGVLNGPHALDEANLDATLAQLRAAVSGTLTVRNSKPRWTKDPFPVKDTYRFANMKPAGPRYDDEPTTAAVTKPEVTAQSVTAPPTARLRTATLSTAPEVTALANTLGTPAKIFAWVHDNVDWDSYSGIAKGSLGTLQERSGNDWDQALLLRDLLAARGYDARLEWGKVTLPIAKAMNLVGTEDPLQAANLLATAGFEGLVLTTNNQPVAVQMTHAWVRAHIPYIPNRGATTGTPDTWVRMDPSFKRYEYQPGININGKVQWSEDEYLQTSDIRPPAEFYGDKIWNYIRTNNIDCVNLQQVTKAGRIRAANYPFVPATLTTRIESVAGLSVQPPAEQMQSVTMTVTDINGAVMSTYTASIAELWGRKLSITFPPATPDDAATINAYGGLFNTPAYLIKLKPVFSIDDQPVADGSPVPAGAVLDLNTTFRQPNVADDYTHHELVAGETHALVLDPGNFPDSLLESRINRLKTLTNEDQILSEKLYLVGLRYMQHVDDGIEFSAGVRWQRHVKRVFEADVRRQIDITYNVAGAAIRLNPAENNIDVSRLLVGIVPINNDLSNRASALALAGLQSSYLEGAIWEEMHGRQGISATKALLLARMSGQQLQTVTAANVNSVLAAANLAADVEAEIRGAVAQGRIAKIALNNISLGGWTGTGYILQDLQTGAATYPISGGLAGGAEVASFTKGIQELLGSESWLAGSPIGAILQQILAYLGTVAASLNDTPSTTQSDPVNMSTGNMYRSMSDFWIAGRGTPVTVLRTYNSRSGYNGPFGHGWTWNYGEQLVMNADGTVTYREGDGSEHVFQSDAAGGFIAPAGKHLELIQSAGGWTMTLKNGARLTFDSRGFLASLIDVNDNTITVQRDAAGLPLSISDAAGATALTFTITAGKIAKVSDVGGRFTSYQYDGDDLVAVTDTSGKTWTMAYDLNHNMTQFADPVGNVQSYSYDTDDRLFQHVDATGAEELFHYDIAGRQSVVTDRRGGDRYIQFDDFGRATLESDPAGNVVRASFDGNNNRTSVVDARGNASAFEFDANGNVTKQTAADGAVTTSIYDQDSRLVTTTTPGGVVTTNTYDSNGNLTQSSRTADGRTEVTVNTYDSDGQLLTTTDAAGATTTLTWNANGTVATRKDAAGGTTTYTTDPLGRIAAVTDPTGKTVSVTYDGKDRVLTLTNPHGATSTYGYDDAGRRVSVTNARGAINYTYDAEGRVVAVKDPMGNVTRTTYSEAGDVLARTDARGNTTKYEYDGVGRLSKMIDAAGGVWTYGYCGSIGSACSSCSSGGASFCELTDPAGKTTKQEFDSMGRVVRVVDSAGSVSLMSYDYAGRKTRETDANGKATTFAYDSAGRLVAVTEASGAVTRYTYDASGNKLTQKDANGNVWSFKYDALNRLIEESDPLARRATYQYDGLGNLISMTDAKTQTTSYEYDGRRLVKATYPGNVVESYTYDPAGRLLTAVNASATTTYTYDGMSRITSVKRQTPQHTLTVQYAYDAAGNRIRMTTPHSASSVTYTYDAKNRLAQIVDPTFGTFRFTHDPLGRRSRLEYPNGIATSYDYDDASRLVGVATKDGAGAVLDAWTYAYDAVGNRTSKTDMAGKSEIYVYDDVHRLTEAHYGDGAFEKFTYDSVGNRKAVVNELGTSIAYNYDAANQLLTAGTDTFFYDGNGNVTSKVMPRGTVTYTYDAKNQLRGIGGVDGTETNLYDAEGNRIDLAGTPIENGQVRVVYDIDRNPILDWGTDNLTWTYRLYAPGVDEPLAEYRRAHNRKTFLHSDALGSITAVSRDTGQLAYRSTYRAFGQMSRTSYDVASTRLGYSAREIGVGGTMQYRSRHYDTVTGRFLQQDSFRGRDRSVPTLHRYAYAANAPTVVTDPSGNTYQDFRHINDFYWREMPMFASIEELVFFVPLFATAWAFLGISSGDFHSGIMLVSRRFLGELSAFDRWDFAATLAHEKMHFFFAGLMWRGAGHEFGVGHNYLAALIDGFTKKNPFDGDQYTQLHAFIDQLGNQAGYAYCTYATSQGIPCQGI